MVTALRASDPVTVGGGFELLPAETKPNGVGQKTVHNRGVRLGEVRGIFTVLSLSLESHYILRFTVFDYRVLVQDIKDIIININTIYMLYI